MSGRACEKHGPQDNWAGVCLAIGEYGKPGGERLHRLVPLCHQCFWEAWALNGKPECVV